MTKYIYDKEDWPKFRWDARALSEGLAAVHHGQDRLLNRMSKFGPDLRAEATLQSLTTEILTSSELAGEAPDPAQIRFGLARRLGRDLAGLAPAGPESDGAAGMMLDATQNYQSPLTDERLFAWHAALFPSGTSGSRKITVGAWRRPSDPAQVARYEAPRALRLSREMRPFLAWFNTYDGIDLILKAGIAHLWFATIHPFADGNGRIARAITGMTLARAEKTPHRFYSLSAQMLREREDYDGVLERTQKGDLDITLWLNWFHAFVSRALDGADAPLAGVLAKARFWDKHRQTSFNDRQREGLLRLLDGPDAKLTSSQWASIAHCSQDTATRDIEDLLQRAILKKSPAGGRSTSYSLVDAPA